MARSMYQETDNFEMKYLITTIIYQMLDTQDNTE